MYEIKKPTKGSRQILELRKELKLDSCPYYVYIHYKEGVPIYVGMGTIYDYAPTDKKQRCFDSHGRVYDPITYVDKVVIVCFYYDKEVAIDIEEQITGEIKNVANWKVYNEDIGNKHSLKTREKISESHKGKQLSDEHKEKLRKHNKGEGNPFYGRHHSDETKQKLRERNLGKKQSKECVKKRSKEIVCVDDLGKITFYNSGHEAEREGYARASITKCCKGEFKQYKKCVWYYYNQIFDIYFGEW